MTYKQIILTVTAPLLAVLVLPGITGDTRPLTSCPQNANCIIVPITPPPSTPAPAPTPVPTAAPSTPRVPTSTDVAQLTTLIARPAATVTSIAIVGNFALASWMNENVGGQIVATNVSGSWQEIDSGMGGFALVDLETRDAAIPTVTAQALVTQAALNQL